MSTEAIVQDPPRRRKRSQPRTATRSQDRAELAPAEVEVQGEDLDQLVQADPFVTGERMPRRPGGRDGWFIDGR